ncbi:ATP-binding cassette domain-containing protein [Actinomadura sp. LD22]|uniref:ATP-binding cassette domain-containing protein n=1 Tax=Actinomadura physcomitrii TaxID=2650748 RepID=A0A6I4M825_9ACTN|nr:branched-chain amino acid ABC transporter permease/ATP-binding protein [Actinomadura physcomitrii]MVZ99900.1 ATP-binding cassette domain-containing protein [Actinomadura physcomitrii]
MNDFVKFLIIGLGGGGVYALLALGVVVTYRGSGVVNFANGAFALIGAAVYYEASTAVPLPAAVVLALLAGALAGFLVQVLIMHRMRNASPLTRVFATLGLLTLVQEAAKHRYGSDAVFVDSLLPTDSVTVLPGITVGEDRLILLGITVVLFGVLYAVYRRTRFGLATTGVAENELAMSTLGWSPMAVAATNWAIGGALSALAGALLVPIVGLAPTSLTLTIIPALSAALVGGFRSLPLTLLGGLLVGVLESEATRYITSPGWSTAAPFAVIVIILVIRGRALPLRSHLTDRLPRVGTGRIRPRILIPLVVVMLASLWIFDGSWSAAVTTGAIYALVCMSLVVLTGYAGQLSLAQFSLAGIGALASSRLADAGGLPFPVAALLGVLITVPVALIVALPALRARGVNLAVVTMGLAVVLNAVVLANPKYTGGVLRGTVVPEPKIFGFSVFATRHPERYAALAVVLLVLIGLVVSNLRRGRAGRRMIAVRDNERAAASLGISVVGAKLYAFGIGGTIAAIAGVLLAFRNPNVQFDQFDTFSSISVVLLAVIGGIGLISGSVVGALGAAGAVMELILSRFFDVSGWFVLLSAILLVLVVRQSPDGVVVHNIQTRARIAKRLRAGRGPDGERSSSTGSGAPSDAGAGDREADEKPAEPAGVSETRRAPRAVRGRVFELRDITMRFGGVTALQDVSLSVAPGEVVGLIGPNGAGKTTLIDVATGFLRSYEGSVLLDGRPIDRWNAVRRARGGLTRSFQSLELFEDLEVDANIRAASDQRSVLKDALDLVRPDNSPLSEAAVASVREFRLQPWLDKLPGDLPYGQRRLVAIARAVATSPSVLLLDEPAAGLDEVSTRELAALIRRLAEQWRMGILLIEHDVSMVLNTCDKIVALDFGRVVATGTPEEIRNNSKVVESYLGSSAQEQQNTAVSEAAVGPSGGN